MFIFFFKFKKLILNVYFSFRKKFEKKFFQTYNWQEKYRMIFSFKIY
jgi:hypothetical protein